jgi:hypothetical protein
VWVIGRVTGREGCDFEDVEVELLRAHVDDGGTKAPVPLDRLADEQRAGVEWTLQGDGYELLLSRVREVMDKHEAMAEDAADAAREERRA